MPAIDEDMVEKGASGVTAAGHAPTSPHSGSYFASSLKPGRFTLMLCCRLS
jgi:hypothetical protein